MINRIRCLCFFVIGFSTPLHALTSDRLQDVHFTAGHVIFDEKTGKGLYDKNVTLTQGTSHLRATHATTAMDKQHRLTQAAAFGNLQKQAHFWTQTATDKPLLHGYANTIYYHPQTHQLELRGHARIIQGENTLTAPNIRYDIQAERLITQAQNNEGTVIRINPKQPPEKTHE